MRNTRCRIVVRGRDAALSIAQPPALVRRHRFIAAVLALGINIVIGGLLAWSSRTAVSVSSETNLEVISLSLTPVMSRVRPQRSQSADERPARHRTVRRVEIRSIALITEGPPSETVAALPRAVEVTDAQLVDETELLQLCGAAIRATLVGSDMEVTVSLRVFVEPDGRISQGRIETSSGDDDLDGAVFRCVQTNGNVMPAVVNDDPVGSWQILHAHFRPN